MSRLRAIVAAACALAALPASAAALIPVPQRAVLTTDRIDILTAAGLRDGRGAVAWTRGTNQGDTTLAMIRPAGGLLPAAPQVLRTGYVGQSLSFLPGPASAPLLTTFDTSAGEPLVAALDGDHFGRLGNPFDGTVEGESGRFTTYARCPDDSTVVARQATISLSPVTYEDIAQQRGPDGLAAGAPGHASVTTGSDGGTSVVPVCDKTSDPLLATNFDPDGAGAQKQRLQVYDLADSTSLPLFDRAVPAGIASYGAPLAHVAPDGRIWVVWTEYAGETPTTYVATRAPGATTAIPTTTPTVLTDGVSAAALFLGIGGTVHALLEHDESPTARSYSLRTAPPGAAAFQAAQPLVPSGTAYASPLLGHPDGAPRLLLARYGSGTAPGTFAIRGIPAAGSTEPETDTGVTANHNFGAFAYLASGDLFGVGVDSTNAPDTATLKEGGLDTGAPPTVSNVSVPGLAAPGVSTPLTADAGDGLGLASFAWSVGGGSLPDQHTAFTFPKPGTYVVTARATDRAGLSTEVSRTVRVLDPDAVSGPAGATPDTKKPSAKVAAKRGRKGKAKRSVTVSVTASETAAADLELIGTLKRGKQKGTLVLRSAHVKTLTAGKARRVKLKVPAALAKLVKNQLRVRATVTDLAGNRSAKTVSVKKG